MNISKNAVYNAANLAMFMVNLPFVLLEQNPIIGSSIEDLKAWFRARKYVVDTLKFSGQNADPNFLFPLVVEQDYTGLKD